jgi:putative DNA primase/helicase
MKDGRLDCLGGLSPVEYAQRRNDLAEDLGVPLKALDAEYKERRKAKAHSEAMHGHWTVEPYPDPVDGGELLRRIEKRIRNHVILSSHSALASSLWTMLAWTHDAAVHSPILLSTSPEAECGKTTLLSLLSFMVPRGLIFVEGSPSVIYRLIEKWHPTLIVDEADKIFQNNPELRAVINSGWTRGSGVPRCHPDTHEPEFFETFGPKAIGLKGLRMPDTTLSRSIIIPMQRKLPDEKAEDFDHMDDEELSEMRSKLLRFANDNLDKLTECRRSTEMPEGFSNRLAANWRLILTIADLCGEDKRARGAAKFLSHRADEASMAVQLLADIVAVMKDGKVDAMHSEDVAAALVELEGRPWAEWGYKSPRPITKNQVAAHLKPFSISPKQTFLNGRNRNGYRLQVIEAALERYGARGVDSRSRTLDPLENKDSDLEFQRTESYDLEAKPYDLESDRTNLDPPRVSKTLDPLKINDPRVLEFQKGGLARSPAKVCQACSGQGCPSCVGLTRWNQGHRDPFDSLKDPNRRLQPKGDAA